MISEAFAQPMGSEVLTGGLVTATANVGTTFGDLLLGTYDNPWYLVGIALVSALAGMLTHWAKVHYKEGYPITFYVWFFKKNIRGTIWATLTMLGALFAAFAPLDYTMITAFQTFTQAWAIGYAADSAFNSSTKTFTDPEADLRP